MMEGCDAIAPGKQMIPISAVRIIRSRERIGRRRPVTGDDRPVESHKALYPRGGRPSYLAPEYEWLIEQMLVSVMEGKSLADICGNDPRLPERRTVLLWLARAEKALIDGEQNNPREKPYIRFFHRYTRARDRLPEALLDDLIPIADDGRNDWIEKKTRSGTIRVVDHEHINRSRLRIETRIKLAEKIAPKKYGTRPEINASTTINDNRQVEQHFYSAVVQRAEQLTRGLPSETLLEPEGASEDVNSKGGSPREGG